MKCESDGCRQYAEFYDPIGNKLCSDCIQIAAETGEYSWDECEAIEEVHADHEHPAVSEGKSAKEIQKGYADYLRAHRGR